MRLALILLAAALPARFAAAAETVGATGFNYISIPQLRATAGPAPAIAAAAAVAPSASAPEKITQPYLLPRAGKKSLFAFPKDVEENKAFLDKWTKILTRANITPGQNDYQAGVISVLPYETGNKLMIREFMAEPRQFKPKDEADLLANMEKISGLTKAAGLPIIASYVSNFDFYLPTYHLYYLTEYKEKEEAEVQVRVLKGKADVLDPAIMEKAGVKVLQQPEPWMVVYLGPEMGVVTRSSDKREDLDAKIAEFQKFIKEQGGTFVTAVVRQLPAGSYRNFEADLYFLR